jgi:hypothetical protein
MGLTLCLKPVEIGDEEWGISILAMFASIRRELSSALYGIPTPASFSCSKTEIERGVLLFSSEKRCKSR